ncbi:MAG: replication-associated recombination protein A, partial [Candidatus Omnitrophica bacterium]|nr:replication-associated recombination protein A [Candidatus Omnitrophota bacterium]
MDLFEGPSKTKGPEPLALRMRPRTFEEFIGQTHIVGEGKLFRRAIVAGRLHSLILYGPPGVGKTALAYLMSHLTHSPFERINATTSNVQELRKIITAAQKRKKSEGKATMLVIDEIHRFNKAQQDVLMPDVEEGTMILVGTTTHNPFFSIVSALLSRSIVLEFKPLTEEEILSVLKRALSDKERGLGTWKVRMEKEALLHLAKLSEGDARRALNALEVGVVTTKTEKDGTVYFTLKVAEESIQKKAVLYDQDEDAHYDHASAFIKSMRGSDPDAALYWLAKMLYAGEDLRFIARRIVICAAEDVGNADPQALVLAVSAQQAV